MTAAPPLTQYAHVPDDLVASATEVNTPSVVASPHADFQGHIPSHHSLPIHVTPEPNLTHASPRVSCALTTEEATSNKKTPVIVSPAHNNEGLTSSPAPHLQNILHGYARRLDILETSSFCHVPAEEIQEMFELVEARLLDLEGWRADVQEQQDAEELPDAASDSSSDGSAISAISSPRNQLADIEQRLNLLEGQYPSFAYPWEIEVVVLPWGVRGLWVQPLEGSGVQLQKPDQETEGWDALPSSGSAAHSRSHANLPARLTRGLPTDPDTRLTPKAPGPNNLIFRRLQSRGLVRKVTITGCGSNLIWETISKAFQSFLVQNTALEGHSASAAPEYHGLRQPFIPLKKIRKSSYLRFLNSYELLTPATWDFAFLKSGIFMQANGLHRLYVTTPDAYVQSNRGQWSWSWLRICGLSVSMPKQLIGELPDETTCEETHWEHYPILDDSSSSEDLSVASSIEDKPTSIVQSQDRNSSECLLGASSSSAVSSRYRSCTTPTWRAHSRSAPQLVDRTITSLSSKRRSLSFEEDIPHYKRRRASRTPEVDVRGACLTPRWSHEPQSPFIPEREVGMRSPKSTSERGDRNGGPQFSYATPHSNNVVGLYIDAGGDTERDSGSNADDAMSIFGSEKAWEGVDDDSYDYDEEGVQRSDTKLPVGTRCVEGASEMDDYNLQSLSMRSEMLCSDYCSGEEASDEEEDDSDDGLTIYEAIS